MTKPSLRGRVVASLRSGRKNLLTTHSEEAVRDRIAQSPIASRLMARVEFDTNGGCWLWTRNLSHNGYGQLKSPGRTAQAHRLAYEEFVGAIPPGLQLDHLCRVRCCCNPAHLEPVTREENIARGHAPHIVNARKTHCKRGHEFTPENTRVNRRGGRACLICSQMHWRSRPPKAKHPAGARPLRSHCKRGHSFSGENLIIDAKGARSCRACRNLKQAVRAVKRREGRPARAFSSQTHCAAGHEYTPETLNITARGDRDCRICQRARNARARARRNSNV